MISVIVPIYNIESYLTRCLESIIGQTYKNFELILVDDGSTDNSGKICDIFAQKDKRIRVIHEKNGGLVLARKRGLQAAQGEYIAYVDGDDWVEPDMLSCLYNKLILENVDVVMCGRYEDTGNMSRKVYHGIPEGRYDKGALLQHVYPNMIVNGSFFEWGIFPGLWDKLFKRQCLEKYQMMVDERITMGEDAACVYPCLLNVESIYVLRKCLYHYRQTPTSMVKNVVDSRKEREGFRILYESVKETLGKYSSIYDLREQWQEYLLFLMIPRSDSLYEGIEKLPYLFPYSHVKRGSRIILYGAGTYGQRLYQYLKRTKFCDVIAVADRNYVELKAQGLPVISPNEISEYQYDSIVIASSFAKVRKSIYDDLTTRFCPEKVQIMEEALIKDESTLRALGVI